MFVYYKCYILIELALLKELMLIKQVHQTNVTFGAIGISINLSDITIINIKVLITAVVLV